jgi:catechol 2,3-dioxygenase-like lactoylglutathione lyase family enzyme
MGITATVLDHIAVTVSDMDRSLHFYRDLLGLREVERHLLEGETISKMAGKPGVVMQVVRLAAQGLRRQAWGFCPRPLLLRGDRSPEYIPRSGGEGG